MRNDMPLFADLDPPPYGLALLRARLDRRGRSRRPTRPLTAAATLGAVALVGAVFVRFALAPPLLEAPLFDHVALVRVDGVQIVADGERMAAVQVAANAWLVP
jgi:hypothetical protein